MATTIENFDFYCVDYAKRFGDEIQEQTKTGALAADEAEHTVTKALKVLQTNGLYAFLLYLAWKKTSGTSVEQKVLSTLDKYLLSTKNTESLLRLKAFGFPIADVDHAFDVGKTLSKDIDNLLLAKELLERTMIYCRYQIKGGGK